MRKSLYLALLLILLTPTKLIAQEAGIIKGEVTSSANSLPLEFIQVIVSGTQIYTMTDSLGQYTLRDVPVGYQRVTFQCVGYERIVSDPILVTVAKSQTLDVEMQFEAATAQGVQVVGRSRRRIEVPPIGVYNLNIQQIEKSPGGNRDISKVVQNLPGVAATSIDRNDLIVRGGGSNENKFYLDRIEIPVLNHFQTQGSSGGNASVVNSDFLSGVTLYTSAFPASRGNALSSVLDLKMKEGNPDKFKTKISVGASDVALTIDTPITPKSSLIASYRMSYLQVLFSMLKLPFLPTYQDAQIKYTHKFDSKNKLTILTLGSYDINRLNTGMSDLSVSRQQILDYLPENDQWSYVVGGVFTHYTQNGSLDFILSTNRLNNSLQKWVDNDYANEKSLDYISNENEVKARVAYNVSLGNGYSLNSGVSVQRGWYDNNSSSMVYLDDYSTYIVSTNTALSLTRYAAYTGVDRNFFGEKLRLNLSMRVDGNNYNEYMSNPIEQFSPRMAFSWGFAPKWKLNGNIGRYYQEPAYTTMGYRDTEGALVNYNRLTYIRSDQATLGFEFTPNDNQRFTFEGFYKGYSNYPMSLVDSTAIGSASSDVYAIGDEPVASVGIGRAYGLEFAYTNQDLAGFSLSTSYTYFYSQFRKLDSNLQPTGDYIPSNWDYRHIFNIVLSRSFGKGWDVGLRWRYMGGAPETPYDELSSSEIGTWNTNGQAVVDYSKTNTLRLAPFHQLDLRVDKSWYFSKWTLSVYLDVQNLYNYQSYGLDILMPEKDSNGNYVEDPDKPGYYKMAYYSNESGGTVIPTFGIIIEF
ncbi:MAG: TonB-dependent receptor [Rikenellaceae bacterium]